MSTNNTFNAAAARELTAQAHSLEGPYLRKETDEIIAMIRTAAQAGKSSASSSHYDKVIINRLESLGYMVKYVPGYDQREPAYIDISW